jgi:hypothetical protein
VVDRHCTQAVRRLGAETACLSILHTLGQSGIQPRQRLTSNAVIESAPAPLFARSAETVRRDASGKNLVRFLATIQIFKIRSRARCTHRHSAAGNITNQSDLPIINIDIDIDISTDETIAAVAPTRGFAGLDVITSPELTYVISDLENGQRADKSVTAHFDYKCYEVSLRRLLFKHAVTLLVVPVATNSSQYSTEESPARMMAVDWTYETEMADGNKEISAQVGVGNPLVRAFCRRTDLAHPRAAFRTHLVR